MLKITLPDGSVREVAPGTTPAEIAAAIGPGLAKAALAAKVDGELRDIMRPFEGDSALALVTAKDEADALELVLLQDSQQLDLHRDRYLGDLVQEERAAVRKLEAAGLRGRSLSSRRATLAGGRDAYRHRRLGSVAECSRVVSRQP